MTFKSLFGQFTILSLSFVTFRVSRFPVSHLTHETVKLGLQNTLNMSKTTRVYFGVLQQVSAIIECKTPVKYKDPGCPTISVNIGGFSVEKALLDLGASVNLLPYSMYK